MVARLAAQSKATLRSDRSPECTQGMAPGTTLVELQLAFSCFLPIVVVTGCWPYLKFQPYASDVPALFRVLNGRIRIKIVEQPLLVEAV